MYFNTIALTAGLAATASAQCYGNYFSMYNRPGNAMSYQRLDPALFPGGESPHLHSFDGGNGLGASTSYSDLIGSSCTTARVKTDKSLYWRPTLFFNNGTDSFYRVPEMSSKIYYKFGDGNNWANVTSFPEGFNMIAGNPMKRSDGDNPAGVRWACHGADGGNAIFQNDFPKGFQTCNGGFASEVTFPSCWNGKEIDPKSPTAHMAYPNGNAGIGIENCPTTHRAARFPTVFIEFWWDISSFKGTWNGKAVPWVLSNGDPTGYGFHGDFMNGWEAGVLEKAIAEKGGCNCGCACGQTEIETCFGADNVNKDDDKAWASCSAMSSYDGDDGSVVNPLPGCNPLQYGPAAATVGTGAGCTAAAAAAPVSSKVSASSAAASQTSATAASSAIYSSVTPDASSAVSSATSAVVGAISSAIVDAASSAAATSSSNSTKSRFRPKTRSSTATSFPSLTAGIPNKQVDTAACTDSATVYKTLTEKITVTVGAVSTGAY